MAGDKRKRLHMVLGLLAGLAVYLACVKATFAPSQAFMGDMFYDAGDNRQDAVLGTVCTLLSLCLAGFARTPRRAVCHFWLPFAALALLTLYEGRPWVSLKDDPIWWIPLGILLRYAFSALWIMSLTSAAADWLLARFFPGKT